MRYFSPKAIGPGAAALKAARAALRIRHNNKARRKLYALAIELKRLDGEGPTPRRERF